MALLRPLTIEEVPQESREHFDCANQWQERQPNSTKKNKMRTMVMGRCPVCLEVRAIAVNDVRNWIAGRRSQMPGTHRKCKYPGRVVTGEGYVHIWNPEHPKAYNGRYVPEHILVMEESMGRYLDRNSESVHHINGDKTDNRIENLQLRKKFHGKGQKWQCGDCGSHNITAAQI